MKLALLHQRMQLNLVNHRRDARFINQALQMMNLEITDADAFYQPLFLQFNHPFPGINVMVDSRYRPVHEIKSDALVQLARLSEDEYQQVCQASRQVWEEKFRASVVYPEFCREVLGGR